MRHRPAVEKRPSSAQKAAAHDTWRVGAPSNVDLALPDGKTRTSRDKRALREARHFPDARGSARLRGIPVSDAWSDIASGPSQCPSVGGGSFGRQHSWAGLLGRSIGQIGVCRWLRSLAAC